VHDGGHGIGVEGRPAGGGEDHRHPPREDVDGAGRPLAGELLGGHVRRGSDEPAGDRGRVDETGDAEIDDARAVRAKQHVGRLEVAMDHPGPVYRGQGGSRTHREALQITSGQRTTGINAFLKRRPVDELADDEAPIAFRRRLDDAGGDKGLHLVHSVEFAAQPLQDRGVDAGPQHFDGDPLFVRAGSAPKVDDALAALAEPGEKLKTAQGQGIARLQRFRRHVFSGLARQLRQRCRNSGSPATRIMDPRRLTQACPIGQRGEHRATALAVAAGRQDLARKGRLWTQRSAGSSSGSTGHAFSGTTARTTGPP
jgi:hypothetical protein